ncbi:MAG: CoA-binding protein [Deltaproteobacteria bacterium]|nr:CoA-binding protein [Deltaproteobacteria bacterium]
MIFSHRGGWRWWALQQRTSFAEIVLHSLIEAEFPAIYPVNPKYNEVLGLKCYPRLLDIPGIVDHVVVNIPAESALSLLDECAEKSVKSVHFFTAGFGESGVKERADLENKLLEKAKAGGFRIIGPNPDPLVLFPKAAATPKTCRFTAGREVFDSAKSSAMETLWMLMKSNCFNISPRMMKQKSSRHTSKV